MAEETVEDLEKKEGEPVAEGEANSNEEKEEEKKEEKEEEEEKPPEKKEPEPECKCEECPKCVQLVPAWMPTFADMATLLMAFFVMILSFAEMNVPKFKQISGTMKNSFGVQRLIPTVEQPKATSVIAQNFSPAVAQPTVLDTVAIPRALPASPF